MKEEQTHCDGKGDHTRSPSGNGPEEQPKDEALRLGRFQEQIPGVTRDGARHTNKAEVRSAFSLNTPGWQRVGLEHGGNASMGLPSRSHQSSRQRAPLERREHHGNVRGGGREALAANDSTKDAILSQK